MNPTLSLTTLLAALCLAAAMTPEYKQRLISSLTDCMKKHNMEKEEIIEIIKNDKLPEDKEKQCIAGCTMNGMGYVKDLTMDWDMIKAANPEKFDTPESVEKANQVIDACAKTVSEKGSDLCELGVKAVTCMHDQAKEAGLAMPEISFE